MAKNRALSADEVIRLLDKGETLTIGEVYDPAMKITDAEEAQRYLAALVRSAMQETKGGEMTEEKALDIARSNLGYYAGYYSNDTRRQVERVFNCAHPVFGRASEGVPTAEEAFEMGLAAGTKKAKEHD